MQLRPHNGVTFCTYETLLPFLADGERATLTTATQPSWFEAAWQRLFTDCDAYVFEGREEVPPAITLIPKDRSIQGRVVLQFQFKNGRGVYALFVTSGGRTQWQQTEIPRHDVAEQLHKALDMLREPLTQGGPATPRRSWEPTAHPDIKPPIDLRPIPLTRAEVPSWWDVHWTGYEFEDFFLPGDPTSKLRPPTIRLDFISNPKLEIVARDYSESPWRETWTAPERPIQILVLLSGRPILEQRLPKDKLRIRPAVSAAVRKLHEEAATLREREHKPQETGLPPPDFDMRRPHQVAPAPAAPVPPEEVDLAPAPALTQQGLFGPFTSLLDKQDPDDDPSLAHTGAQFTYIAGSGSGPPTALFRRTERALDPTELELSKEDRILVLWYGGRWKRKGFPKEPYNLKVYFTNRLLSESNVASVKEAWRLVQKANDDLAIKRRRVEVADLKFKPIKITVNKRLLELDPPTVAKIRAVIATGSTYMFKYRGKELYGVRKGKKPKVISVPYGDTKPVYVKSLDAWVGLIKAEG